MPVFLVFILPITDKMLALFELTETWKWLEQYQNLTILKLWWTIFILCFCSYMRRVYNLFITSLLNYWHYVFTQTWMFLDKVINDMINFICRNGSWTSVTLSFTSTKMNQIKFPLNEDFFKIFISYILWKTIISLEVKAPETRDQAFWGQPVHTNSDTLLT